MHRLFTKKQLEQARSKELLPLLCKYCKKVFYRTKHRIQDAIKPNRADRLLCCNQFCSTRYRTRHHRVKHKCFNCGKALERVLSQSKQSVNHFCCHSCSAIYNNTHKTKGIRRSKLECWLEKQLGAIFPSLDIHYNMKDAINSELDIYIPSLKLAFELNGIFHYEAIYGTEKLSKIQNNDSRKFQACIEHGIELCIIDTSQHTHVTPKTSQKFLDIIVPIIKNKLAFRTDS